MKWTKEEDKILVKNYGKILVREILLKRSSISIRNRARRLKLKSQLKGQGKRKYICNNNFFSKPNLNNCYWAGFIAADGSIVFGRNCLKISLAIKDKQHLETFKKSIKFNGPLISDNYGMITLSIHSKQICEDLKNNFSITSRKTFSLQPPILFKNIFVLSFIKGYIDGDGWLTFEKHKKYKYLSIGILGTECMMLWIRDQLNNILELNLTSNIIKIRNVYRFAVTGKNAELIKNKLNNISTGLDRKWKL